MRIYVNAARKSTVWLRAATLVLLAVALVIPQLSWADHASDHPDRVFDTPSNEAYAALVAKYATGELVFHPPGRRDDSPMSVSPSEAYAALVKKYTTGELVFHPPGRRDDSPMSVSPSEAYAALVKKYMTGELVFNTPGRRDDRAFTVSANLVQADEAFLAANPEMMISRRFVASLQTRADAASSARWVALGAYYSDMGATFLAANPETMISRRYVASLQARADAASSARWVALGAYYSDMDATFLAANPEVMTYRRYAQGSCSLPGQGC